MDDYLNARKMYNPSLQHNFLDVIKLERELNDNTQYHVILTLEESRSIIDDLKPRQFGSKINGGDFSRGTVNDSSFKSKSRGECFSRGVESRESEFGEVFPNRTKTTATWSPFRITGPLSSYAGNIYDSRGVYDVVREFKRLSVTATEYIAANGSKYIHISGYAGFRRIITGTRYGASHPKMLSMGIGQQGITSGIVNGVRFCIVFSVAYRTIEYIFKDEYTLADFIGNITVDMAKTAIIAVTSFAIGSVLTSVSITGVSIIAVSGGIFTIGLIAAYSLAYIDKEYGISDKLIALLKSAWERKPKEPRVPEADFNGALHTWSRFR